MFSGKKILLGITGSIAAYKSAGLIRLLIKEGAEVKVVMTSYAKEFITPLTLSTLSKHPVLSESFSRETGEWNNHIELGRWADLIIIAPASMNSIAKLAHGMCDNLLMAVCLASKCPIYIAPAMDVDMYQHPSNQKNLKILQSFNYKIIFPNVGELASGLYGEGRMAEPEQIIAFLEEELSQQLPLRGQKALVTAGPTFEAIDPVRFIANHSSGKMGFAIAEELASKGAEVILITGPVNLQTKNLNINRINVISAEDMYNNCRKYFPSADITIMSAAVADYKPASKSLQKLKKKPSTFALELVPTKDILAELSVLKKDKQKLIGFALESEQEIKNAQVKLKNKNLDFIVLNSINNGNKAFGSDKNKITIIDKHNKITEFELKPKSEVAKDIIQKIINNDV